MGRERRDEEEGEEERDGERMSKEVETAVELQKTKLKDCRLESNRGGCSRDFKTAEFLREPLS